MLELILDDVVRLNDHQHKVNTVLMLSDNKKNKWNEYGLSDNVWLWVSKNRIVRWEGSIIDTDQPDIELSESGSKKISIAIGRTDRKAGDDVEYAEYVNKRNGELYYAEEHYGEVWTFKGCVIDESQIEIIKKANHKGKGQSFWSKLKDYVLNHITILISIGLLIVIFRLMAGQYKYLEDVGDDAKWLRQESSVSGAKNYISIDGNYSDVRSIAIRIINESNGYVVWAQDSKAGDAVAMNTDKDFCLVYQTIDNKTRVHICSREYLFNNLEVQLYKASADIQNFYMAYYANVLYSNDSTEYYKDTNKHYYPKDGYGPFSIDSKNDYLIHAATIQKDNISRNSSSRTKYSIW